MKDLEVAKVALAVAEVELATAEELFNGLRQEMHEVLWVKCGGNFDECNLSDRDLIVDMLPDTEEAERYAIALRAVYEQKREAYDRAWDRAYPGAKE